MTKVVASEMERHRKLNMYFEEKKLRDLLIYEGSDKKRRIQDDC